MKSTFKNLIATLSIFLLLAGKGQGQNQPEITLSETGKLSLKTMPVDNKTAFEKVVALIGKASRVNEYGEGEVEHVYDNLGLVVNVKNGLVNGLTVFLVTEKKKKQPEGSFTGSLKIGSVTVDKSSSSKTFADIKAPKFNCPFPMMCLSDKSLGIKCTAGFNETITELAFVLN